MMGIFGKIKRKVSDRSYWENGAGEVIGFMVITPILAFFLVTFISVIQVGMIHSRLEYAAYAACRAAVVSKDKEEAEERAKKALALNMADVSAAYDMSTLESVFELHEVKKSMTVVSKDGKKATKTLETGKTKGWEKGATVTCIVSCNVRTLSDVVVGTNPTKSASVTMMIEKGNTLNPDEIADLAYAG